MLCEAKGVALLCHRAAVCRIWCVFLVPDPQRAALLARLPPAKLVPATPEQLTAFKLKRDEQKLADQEIYGKGGRKGLSGREVTLRKLKESGGLDDHHDMEGDGAVADESGAGAAAAASSAGGAAAAAAATVDADVFLQGDDDDEDLDELDDSDDAGDDDEEEDGGAADSGAKAAAAAE